MKKGDRVSWKTSPNEKYKIIYVYPDRKHYKIRRIDKAYEVFYHVPEEYLDQVKSGKDGPPRD